MVFQEILGAKRDYANPYTDFYLKGLFVLLCRRPMSFEADIRIVRLFQSMKGNADVGILHIYSECRYGKLSI